MQAANVELAESPNLLQLCDYAAPNQMGIAANNRASLTLYLRLDSHLQGHPKPVQAPKLSLQPCELAGD